MGLIQDADEYCVYWWNDIPLGHCWKEKRNVSDRTIPAVFVWNAIQDTLRFYCLQQNEIKFEDIKIAWSNNKYAGCTVFLENLFLPFIQQIYKEPADISLIICTRNRPLQLKSCLDSLSKLSRQPAEIIIVDNAPDNVDTKKIVDEYSQVKYILEETKGLDIARNTGWQHATSSIIAYTDDDVCLHKDWIQQIAIAFDHPRGTGGYRAGVRARNQYSSPVYF